jgi:hypothetical protein
VGKPVLITRVMDTMAVTPRPTRAEATGEGPPRPHLRTPVRAVKCVAGRVFWFL